MVGMASSGVAVVAIKYDILGLSKRSNSLKTIFGFSGTILVPFLGSIDNNTENSSNSRNTQVTDIANNHHSQNEIWRIPLHVGKEKDNIFNKIEKCIALEKLNNNLIIDMEKWKQLVDETRKGIWMQKRDWRVVRFYLFIKLRYWKKEIYKL